jgi:hypothetical protein
MLEKLIHLRREKAVSGRKAAVPGREPDVHVVGIGSTWEGSGRKNCQGCRALPPGTGRRGRRGPPTPWH